MNTVDANLVIDKLVQKVAQLTRENAVLQAHVEELLKNKESKKSEK